MNTATEPHLMRLETTHPDGSEEWVCEQCGRRMLVTWAPEFQRRVLVPGDEQAVHTGGKGGLEPAPPQAEPVAAEDAERLAPWVAWLESVDFESWWERDTDPPPDTGPTS